MNDDTLGLTGYAMLLEALLDGGLPAAAFEAAMMRLWSADRDRERAVTRGEPSATTSQPERARITEDLLAQACAGQMRPADFGRTWASIWAFEGRRPRVVANIVDILHGYTYRYTTDPALLAEKPAFYIDEAHLRLYMMPLRDVLAVLTDDD